MKNHIIPFSPPDITQKEIDSVVEVLKSGWITTGPKTALFEEKIKEYCSVQNAVTVASNSQGLDLILKVMGIGPPDEVITTPYTYVATSNAILHRGIKPTFVDLQEDSYFMDNNLLYDAITPRTKAILTVDIGGFPADYDALKQILKSKKREDILLIADSAHSFGAYYQGERAGGQLDYHVFSFHAVKNLTTAEGGAITFNNENTDLARIFKYSSLNGQSKDALAKMKAGGWRYDVLTDGLKCNMTDISAAIGLAQLERYSLILEHRKALAKQYDELLSTREWAILPPGKDKDRESSYHLYLLRVRGLSEEKRDSVIQELADIGISTNVHYIPVPMFTWYRESGYSIDDYPNAWKQYANEITLPLYSKLSLEDCAWVAENVISTVEKYL